MYGHQVLHVFGNSLKLGAARKLPPTCRSRGEAMCLMPTGHPRMTAALMLPAHHPVLRPGLRAAVDLLLARQPRPGPAARRLLCQLVEHARHGVQQHICQALGVVLVFFAAGRAH